MESPLASGINTDLSSLSKGTRAWFNCSLSLTMLNLGTTYYVLFNCSHYVSNDWFGTDVDFQTPNGPYGGGCASTDPDGDFCFKTYYDSATAAAPEVPFYVVFFSLALIIPLVLIRKKEGLS